MDRVNANNSSYKQTQKAWQPFYDYKLTPGDAIEIQSNLSKVYKILKRWDEQKNEETHL